MIRLFIGIPLPHDFSTGLIAFQEENKFVQGIKWVPDRNLHVTLCFIGNYAPDKLAELKKKLSLIASKTNSFQMEFEHFQFGPSFNKAYMLWAKFRKNDNFAKLALKMDEDILKKISKKEPIPHITLCRFKRIEKEEIKLNFPVEINKITVNQFNLYESLLEQSGAEYRKLHEFKLMNA